MTTNQNPPRTEMNATTFRLLASGHPTKADQAVSLRGVTDIMGAGEYVELALDFGFRSVRIESNDGAGWSFEYSTNLA